MRICDRCESKDRVEEHHLWCKFLDNPHGYSFEGNVSRVWLCWDCHHIKIHKEIIIPILKFYSTKSNYIHEGKLWEYILVLDKKECISKIVKETLDFLKEEQDGKNI